MGLGIVLALNAFVRPQPPFAIVTLKGTEPAIKEKGEGIVMAPLGGGRYLVEFGEGVETSWFEYTLFDASKAAPSEPVHCEVDRYGLRKGSRKDGAR
jgi:hypothetical protein